MKITKKFRLANETQGAIGLAKENGYTGQNRIACIDLQSAWLCEKLMMDIYDVKIGRWIQAMEGLCHYNELSL